MTNLAIPLLLLLTTSATAYPPFDIVYLLDSSGSISSANFTAEKNFALNSANGLGFGPTSLAASLITFANTASVKTNFTTSNTTFINIVNTTVQTGGTTDLTAGLTAALNEFTSFGRANKCRILALLTDGPPTLNPTGVSPKLDELAAAGIHVFPIVVGSGNTTYMQSLVRNEGQLALLNSLTYMGFNEAVAHIPLHALFGDFNRDNKVDGADYTMWRHTLASSVLVFTGADGNGNSVIDAGDYDAWRDHFGISIGSGARRAAVPEPTALVLLMAAVLSLTTRRRKSVPRNRV